MKSAWRRTHQNGHDSPIEMRFIDMFMTALGALVFLALLLVFLLPKVEASRSTKSMEEMADKVKQMLSENAKLSKSNADLQAQVARLTAPIPVGTSSDTEDPDIMRRWFSVLALLNGCRSGNPTLYVRWEGRIVDNDGKSLPDAVLFDATAVHTRTRVRGDTYHDLDTGLYSDLSSDFSDFFSDLRSEPFRLAPPFDNLQKGGFQTRAFHGVARSPGGSYSIYIGLEQPSVQGETPCYVQPIYLAYTGRFSGERITLTARQPFAWLRRFRIESGGSTSFGTVPRDDKQFLADIAEFSKKQSQALCEKRKVCGTIDAHYALLAPAEIANLEPGSEVKDCDVCPELVVIRPGAFQMGAPKSELGFEPTDGPQRPVTIPRKFAVGRYAVTFDQWGACVAEGGCPSRPDENWGRNDRPVINVSWNDATQYVRWLSTKTNKKYRLLSEAEREYVTRAGNDNDPFWWGQTITTNDANYDGTVTTYKNSRYGAYLKKTAPVRSYRANPFGLYQVHGNVFEWTQDCFNERSAPGPGGSAATNGDCSKRVARGGSWRSNARFLRAAYRIGLDQSKGLNNVGFRVARD